MDLSSAIHHTVIYHSDNIAALNHPDAEIAIISFASMGANNDKAPFEFLKALSELTVNIIFVKDPSTMLLKPF